MLASIVILAAAALATALLMFPIRAVLRRAGVVDKPNARSSHQVPTVRGGGVAVVAVVAIAIAWLAFRDDSVCLAVLLGAFGLLAVVSFIDDLKGLPARVRFLVHAGSAIAAVVCLITGYRAPITAAIVAIGMIALVWAAGYTNAFNFMDGINGIAGMQALVTGVGTAVIAIRLGVAPGHASVLLSCVIAGAALGFLPHNFPRARVFMGDVSSAALGFLLAVLAFWIAQRTSPWVLFWIALLHANFILDTGITLVRRALRGDRLHEAHRDHFYQRLVRSGWSHTRVTLTEAGLQGVVAVALGWATPASPQIRLLVGVGVIALWLGFFAVAEGVFRNAARAAVHPAEAR